MTKKISIALAQMDFVVGDISGNTELIIEASKKAKKKYNADLIVFPELSISGYPPEDLLLHSGFKKRIFEASNKIQQEINGIDALVGYPEYQDEKIEFLGEISNSQTLEIISNAKAVITATKLFEGQPTLLCEASSLGAVSIFPKTGGISEFFPKDSFSFIDIFNIF